MTKLPKGSKLLDQGNGVSLYEVPPDPRKQYPLWNVDALKKDIANAERSIESFEAHIADQRRLIEEREEQVRVCQERDRKIAEWDKDRADLGQEK